MSSRIHCAGLHTIGLGILLLAAPLLATAKPPSSPSVLCRVAERLQCFRIPSGELLWQRDDIQAPAEITPQGDRLWVARGRKIEGLLLADGSPFLQLDNDHELFAARIAGPLLILADQGGWLRVLDLDRNRGRERWRRRLSDGWIYPPAIDGKRLYAGGSNARVTALDRSTGQDVWERGVGQELVTGPLLAGGWLWVATFDARLQVLDPETGQAMRSWKLKTPLFDLQTDGRRVLGADYAGHLQAFDARTRRRLWTAAVAQSQDYRFGLDDERVAVIDPRGRILQLDSRTGRRLHRFRFEPEVTGEPVLSGSRVWLSQAGQPLKGALRPSDRLRPVTPSPGGEP